MTTAPIADLSGFERRKEHRAWYWYDWANSAYVTTVGTVLFAPYLTSVAERAACGRVGTDENPCNQDLTVFGLSVSPGSLVFYVVTVATILSALIATPTLAEPMNQEPGLYAFYHPNGDPNVGSTPADAMALAPHRDNGVMVMKMKAGSYRVRVRR